MLPGSRPGLRQLGCPRAPEPAAWSRPRGPAAFLRRKSSKSRAEGAAGRTQGLTGHGEPFTHLAFSSVRSGAIRRSATEAGAQRERGEWGPAAHPLHLQPAPGATAAPATGSRAPPPRRSRLPKAARPRAAHSSPLAEQRTQGQVSRVQTAERYSHWHFPRPQATGRHRQSSRPLSGRALKPPFITLPPPAAPLATSLPVSRTPHQLLEGAPAGRD